MADSVNPRVPAQRPADDPTYHVDPGHGWVLFAGIMLMVIGVLNVIFGIAAIDDAHVYVRDAAFIFGNLNTWGWVLLIVGIVQVCAAVGIWTNAEWGRWLGIGFAVVNMFVQFLVLPAYPLWAVIVFMVDVIVVYGLLSYGGRDRQSLAEWSGGR
jgi:hypothetical protein